jgi:hypothetical protein
MDDKCVRGTPGHGPGGGGRRRVRGDRRAAAGRCRAARRRRRGGRAGAPLPPAERRDAGTGMGGARLAASAGPSPAGGVCLREGGRGRRDDGGGEGGADTAAAAAWDAWRLWISVGLNSCRSSRVRNTLFLFLPFHF